jgi:hypothetical protein
MICAGLRGEATSLWLDTAEKKIVWKLDPNQSVFVCSLADGTRFEIGLKSRYVIRLSKYDSRHILTEVLQNDEPLLGETAVSGGHCDESGYIKDRIILPLSALTPLAHELALLHDAAMRSASVMH